MPTKKRGRADSEDEGEERGGAVTPVTAKLCGNGHPLVLVSKEVRRLEKDKTWSCDGDKCSLDWDGEGGLYLERARYRCVHYHNQGACNYDLCGDCYSSADPRDTPGSGSSVRRSARESRPSSVRREEEWQLDKKAKMDKMSPSDMSPGRVGRRSRDQGQSPGSILTRGIRKLSPHKTSPGKQDTSPRRTRGGNSESRHSPSAKKHSPKIDYAELPRRSRTRNGNKNGYNEETESTGESDTEPNTSVQEVDSPFYPQAQHHVRFSPSAKAAKTDGSRSPWGRKTRSTRRGIASHIQSLPSEDEQSEFNRHYRSDLRRRQQRRVSEEDNPEDQDVRKSTRSKSRRRMDSETSGGMEELSLASRKSMRSMRRRKEEVNHEEEEDSEGVGDPTVTEASLRRSSRRRGSGAPPAGEEADTESGVDKQDSDEEQDEDMEEEEEEAAVEETRRQTRRTSGRMSILRGASSTSTVPTPDETPIPRSTRSRSRRIPSSGEEEEEQEEGEENEDLEDGELEDEAEDGSRRSSRRNRNPVDRYQPGLEEPSSRGRRHESEESESEDEPRRVSRRSSKKKISPLKRSERRRNEVRRYTDDRNTRDEGISRKGGNMPRSGGRNRGGEKDRRRRHRTGDSSSPTDSDSSDEEAFEKRKSKRMRIEMERMRPLNMSKKDLNQAKFRDRQKAGSSMADIQPMEMDMGVTFESVGGLKDQVDSLKEMVMFPLLYPEMFKKFDMQPPRGVLFYGPPGTGKTLLARALASECSSENKKVAFFMRKGADCLSKWIGESERQLRMLFDQAYQMRPSIIFFDEIDGLAPVRSSRQDQIHSSIVSTLLALMDGLDNRGEIVIIGATNRIENIDPALRRPGRFDREFPFFLPNRKTRKEIIKIHTKSWDPPLSDALLNTLGTKTIGYGGADLKGLTAEAALNSLRRSFPQVYETNQKLAIDMKQVQVRKVDFDKALRKIVPSTHRVEDKVISPLPKQVRPLLSATLANLQHQIKKIFPHATAGKGAVLPASLTHRPRLLMVGGEGQGVTTYLAPALLHFMEKLPVTKLDIAALFSNSARTPEEAVTTLIHQARRTQPSVLYIPHLTQLWEVCGPTVKATLCTSLADCPPTAPMLVLAVSSEPYHSLDTDLQQMFQQHYRETYKVENPGENERREFFRPLVTSCSQPPYQPPPPAAPRESLPVLPAPESRALTEREEKRLKRKEETLLRELRIFLRDIWTKINRDNKFFMFRMPVNTDEVDDYLKYVKVPMDFETMHMKLDDGEYSCAQDFLNDIDLIAENAIEYNCDLKYETNRIICHRSRALQDYAYALVKAEMDTDFEDECKEIHRRRIEASDKLKKIDKDEAKVTKQITASPSKMQDILAIVSTACEVCKSKDDEDSMLLCDGCDKGYHIYCVQPPIETIPEGDWFCPACVAAGAGKDGATPTSAESRRGTGRARRKKSRWSSGVVPKKKPSVKKRILDSDEEDEAQDQSGSKEEEDKEEDIPDTPNIDPDLTPSSPRPSGSRTAAPASAVASGGPALADREEPSVPTGVRIDQAKVTQWSNDLVRFTDNFPTEKLERVYSAMNKVIRRFRTQSDRTDLPTELQAELQTLKSQERDMRRS